MTLRAVILRSPAYSGTTWTALVLASHPEAMALGAGDRIWSLTPEQADQACLIHGADCPFWPAFIRDYDRSAPFLPQLAEYSGKTVFTINNPSPGGVENALAHPDVTLKYVKQVRDGRATLRSWMRHHPERYPEFYDAVRAWLYHTWDWLENGSVPAAYGTVPILRYEDLVTDWRTALQAMSDYIGIDYDDGALRYWEYDHHLPTGNSGVIDQLRRMAGLTGFDHHRRGYYDRVIEAAEQSPLAPVIDDSWETELSEVDRVGYDFIVGALHEKFGYERDAFGTEAIMAFARRYDPPATPQEAVQQIPRFRRDATTPAPASADSPLRQMMASLTDLIRRRRLSAQD